jgi:hypothetical protein
MQVDSATEEPTELEQQAHKAYLAKFPLWRDHDIKEESLSCDSSFVRMRIVIPKEKPPATTLCLFRTDHHVRGRPILTLSLDQNSELTIDHVPGTDGKVFTQRIFKEILKPEHTLEGHLITTQSEYHVDNSFVLFCPETCRVIKRVDFMSNGSLYLEGDYLTDVRFLNPVNG